MSLIDAMQETPRGGLTGLLADALSGIYNAAGKIPAQVDAGRVQGLLGLLGVPAVAKTLDRISYGEPLTNAGKANVPLLRPETADAALAVAPFAGPAARGAGRVSDAAVRAITGNAAATGPAVLDFAAQMGGAINPATVWHGSPHVFDKFDASKIGSGEGAQAYGHGLYLADNPNVARGYQEKLSDAVYKIDGAAMPGNSDAVIVASEIQQRGAQGAKTYLLEQADNAARLASESGSKKMQASADNFRKWASLVDEISARQFSIENGGALYKVDLPDSAISKMLDWDKPLSQQPAAANYFRQMHEMNGGKGYVNGDGGYTAIGVGSTDALTGRDLVDFLSKMGAGRSDASALLRQTGVPGIRYLDGGSRGAGAGTSNYVVFPGEENLLTILERNGVPLP